MKKKIFIFLTALVVLLAGCGNVGNAEREKLEEEKDVIEVWASFGIHIPGNHYIELWEELSEQYDCEIDIKTYSVEQMKSKLRTALVCNELPDVFFVWGGTYPEFLFEAGACMPVQEVLEASDVTFKESYTIPYKDGNNYIIPCMPEDYGVVYYNQKLMDLMGLTVPTTWEELIQLVKDVNAYNAVHNTKYTPINLGNKNGENGELLYCTIVERLEPDAYEELKTGKRTFEDEVFVEAAQRVSELEELNAFSYDFMEVGEKEAIDNFTNQEAVIFPSRSSAMYYLMENMEEDSFHMMPFPVCNNMYKETSGTYMIDINHTLTSGFCVNASSPYQEQAAQICLDFAKKVNDCNVSEYGYTNMTETELPYPAELPGIVREFQQMQERMEECSPCWYAELPLENADAWRNLTKKLYAGEINIEEFTTKGTECLVFDSEY